MTGRCAPRAATEFYRQHRAAMDEGAVVAWSERHNPDELSAIQNAMNLKLQNEVAFWSEYQNEPLPEEKADEDLLTADEIAAKVSGLRRGEVPIGCTHVGGQGRPPHPCSSTCRPG